MFDKFTARNFMKQTSEKLQNSLDTSIAIGRNIFLLKLWRILNVIGSEETWQY